MPFPGPTERQARIIWLALSGFAIALLVALLAGLIWGLSQVVRILSPVLWPLAAASVLAYLLDPVVDFLQGRGTSRVTAIVTVFGIALVVIGTLFGTIVPQLISETRQLTSRIPDYASKAAKQLEERVNRPPLWLQRLLAREGQGIGAYSQTTNAPAPTLTVPTNTVAATRPAATNSPSLLETALAQENVQLAAGSAAKVIRNAGIWLYGHVSTGFSILVGLALVPVYTFYFLLEKRGISSRWTNYLPLADSRFKDELVFVLNSINNYLIAFFRGQVLVAICDGTLYGLGFLIVGLPYALLIGFAAMFLTLIPFLGAIIIFITALVISLVQFGDWLHPLLVLIVFGFVQALESLFISPKIMGGRVGLHPVTIIIAVMVGTTLLGGLLGGVLAIPLTAALRVVMTRYVWKRDETPSEV
jgi:predicted PurR-regulated permease PerM